MANDQSAKDSGPEGKSMWCTGCRWVPELCGWCYNGKSLCTANRVHWTGIWSLLHTGYRPSMAHPLAMLTATCVNWFCGLQKGGELRSRLPSGIVTDRIANVWGSPNHRHRNTPRWLRPPEIYWSTSIRSLANSAAEIRKRPNTLLMSWPGQKCGYQLDDNCIATSSLSQSECVVGNDWTVLYRFKKFEILPIQIFTIFCFRIVLCSISNGRIFLETIYFFKIFYGLIKIIKYFLKLYIIS